MKFKRLLEADDFDVTSATDYEHAVGIKWSSSDIFHAMKEALIKQYMDGDRIADAEQQRAALDIFRAKDFKSLVTIFVRRGWDINEFCKVIADSMGIPSDIDVNYRDLEEKLYYLFNVDILDFGWTD